MFGVTAEVCAIAWDLLEFNDKLPKDGHKEHFMWALIFLKTYKTEDILASDLGGIDEKTLRKWVTVFVKCIADVKAPS